MTPEEKLAYNAQIGREQYQSKQVRRQQMRDRQISPLQVQSWDCDRGAYRATAPDGTVRYVEPLTNGAIAAGDAVRPGLNRIDAMPAPKFKPEVVEEIPVIFDFYVGFGGYITTARDRGSRSLPIKSLLDDNILYSSNEAGFVSARDGFIYSAGGAGAQANRRLYKIDPADLSSIEIENLSNLYGNNAFFAALCLSPDDNLFAVVQLDNNTSALIYKRSPDGIVSSYPINGDGVGNTWSIATLDGINLYLVSDYAKVYKFSIASNQLTLVRDALPEVAETTFLFADNRYQNLYLFGLTTNSDAPRGQSTFWRLQGEAFEEYYRFPVESGDNAKRFYGLPSRSAIADTKTKTIFMIGVETIYTNTGFGTTISNTNKIMRLDRSKRLTDFNLKFDSPDTETDFDFFGQLDWVY